MVTAFMLGFFVGVGLYCTIDKIFELIFRAIAEKKKR